MVLPRLWSIVYSTQLYGCSCNSIKYINVGILIFFIRIIPVCIRICLRIILFNPVNVIKGIPRLDLRIRENNIISLYLHHPFYRIKKKKKLYKNKIKKCNQFAYRCIIIQHCHCCIFVTNDISQF